MKKLKILEVLNINAILNNIVLRNVPMEDVRAIMHLCREITPITDNWQSFVKEAVNKLKDDNITDEQLNKHLNDALSEEILQEVEVPSLTISPEGEDLILAQSHITRGELETVKVLLKPEDTK